MANNLTIAQGINLANKELVKATNNIIKAGEKVGSAQMEIAYNIAKVNNSECLEQDGFKNVADYLTKVFGMSKTTAYDLIAVSELIDTETRKCALPKANSEWSHTQLRALLPIRKEFKNSFLQVSTELVNQEIINSDMSVRDLATAVNDYLNPQDETDTEETESDDLIDADAVETDTAIYTFTFTEWENKGIVMTVNGEELPADFTREQLTQLCNALLAKYTA